MRRLRSFLGLTGGDNAWRVVIVDSADELNINAANALLKSLEEPPARALFLLISSEPSGLLPTIRSRCRRLDLAPLSPAKPAGGGRRRARAPQTWRCRSRSAWPRLERLAEGSVRRALQLAAAVGLELHERIEAIYAALPQDRLAAPRTPYPTSWASAPRSSASRPSTSSFLICWRGWCARAPPVAATRTSWRWRGA